MARLCVRQQSLCSPLIVRSGTTSNRHMMPRPLFRVLAYRRALEFAALASRDCWNGYASGFALCVLVSNHHSRKFASRGNGQTRIIAGLHAQCKLVDKRRASGEAEGVMVEDEMTELNVMMVEGYHHVYFIAICCGQLQCIV